MKKSVVTLLSLFLVVGCASTGRNHTAEMKNLIGKPVGTVVKKMGYPSDKFVNHSNREVYVYHYSETAKTTEYTYDNGAFGEASYGGKTYEKECTVFIHFLPGNKHNPPVAYHWDHQGPDCPF